MKLLQGIEAFEEHIEKDKEMQEVHVPKKEKETEVSNKVSDKTKVVSEVKPEAESQKEMLQTREQLKQKTVHMSSSKAKGSSNKMLQKQVFSFRAVTKDISIWKAYSTATARTMENIGTDAMNEYIKKHKLSEAESAVFNALIAKDIGL